MDFVQVRLDEERCASIGDCDLDRLLRAREAGADDLVDPEMDELLAEESGLALSARRQPEPVRGVAVEDVRCSRPTRRGGRR